MEVYNGYGDPNGLYLVHSFSGLTRLVCEEGSDCSRNRCSRAHANASYSTVLHPKWCLYAPMNGCLDEKCPFNHFRNNVEFVRYRRNDPIWARSNRDMVKKYSRAI